MQRVSTTVIALASLEVMVRRRWAAGSGSWWPNLDRLLDGVDRVVPDQA